MNPIYVTLTADTQATVTLDANYSRVEVAMIANGANTYFNTTDTAIGAVGAGSIDGCHVITTTLPAKVVQDGTAGAVSKVRLRSTGTPTLSVLGL